MTDLWGKYEENTEKRPFEMNFSKVRMCREGLRHNFFFNQTF